MNLFKTTVMSGTTLAGGMAGKSLGVTILGSAIIGVLPLAAVGAFVGYKLVDIFQPPHQTQKTSDKTFQIRNTPGFKQKRVHGALKTMAV